MKLAWTIEITVTVVQLSVDQNCTYVQLTAIFCVVILQYYVFTTYTYDIFEFQSMNTLTQSVRVGKLYRNIAICFSLCRNKVN